MDGTVLESMYYWRISSLEYVIEHNLPVNEELLSGVFKRGAGATVKMAYALAGRDDYEAELKYISSKLVRYVYAHYLKDVKPKPYAIDFLKKLREEGVRCCIATATDKEFALEALKVHGMDEYFEFIFDESDAGCSKANEQYFERLLEKLGCEKNECMLFEDAAYSIRTAKKFGIRVTGIEDTYAIEGSDIVKALSDQYVCSFSELI